MSDTTDQTEPSNGKEQPRFNEMSTQTRLNEMSLEFIQEVATDFMEEAERRYETQLEVNELQLEINARQERVNDLLTDILELLGRGNR